MQLPIDKCDQASVLGSPAQDYARMHHMSSEKFLRWDVYNHLIWYATDHPFADDFDNPDILHNSIEKSFRPASDPRLLLQTPGINYLARPQTQQRNRRLDDKHSLPGPKGLK